VPKARASHSGGKAGRQGTRFASRQGRAGYGHPDGCRAEGKREQAGGSDSRVAGDDGPREVRSGSGRALPQGEKLRGVRKVVQGQRRADRSAPQQRVGDCQNRVAQGSGADQRMPGGRSSPESRVAQPGKGRKVRTPGAGTVHACRRRAVQEEEDRRLGATAVPHARGMWWWLWRWCDRRLWWSLSEHRRLLSVRRRSQPAGHDLLRPQRTVLH